MMMVHRWLVCCHLTANVLALSAWGAEPLPMARGVGVTSVRPQDPASKRILLTARTIDTRVPDPLMVQGLALMNRGFQDPAYFLLQSSGLVTEEWKQLVTQGGAQIIGHLPRDTVLVRATATVVQQLTALPEVRWAGLYHPQDKLSPDLRWRLNRGTPQQELIVSTFPGEDVNAVAQAVTGWGGRIVGVGAAAHAGRLRVSIDKAFIPLIARLVGVRWIEPDYPTVLFNDIATGIMNAASVWASPLSLTGSGQTVGIADSGLDTGNLATVHRDIRGRIAQAFTFQQVTGSGRTEWSDLNGHGTHVTGSVAGNATESGGVGTGFAGTANAASVVFQCIGSGSGSSVTVPSPLTNLFAQAMSAGAVMHTNSWGSPVSGAYTTSSQDVDQFMWDNKDFLILFSAGNSGADNLGVASARNGYGQIDPDSLGAPGTAKNSLTVGATENFRPSPSGGVNRTWNGAFGYPNSPIATDHVSNNAGGMAAFSSRGPTDDGRIKPDVCAPGTNIISMRSSVGGTLWGHHNAFYEYSGGTSMSTPLVAGAAALVRQFYTDRKGHTPSAALLKATLINGATDLSPGQYGPPPATLPLFNDDAESGGGNWTASGGWAISTEQAHSGTHCFSDSPGGDYSDNANATLTTNSPVSVSQHGFLTWWQRFDTETNYDFLCVEARVGASGPWETLAEFTGTTPSAWEFAWVDLNRYAGASLYLRFRLATDSSVTQDGCYLDDIRIGEFNNTLKALETFEAGSTGWTSSTWTRTILDGHSGNATTTACMQDSAGNYPNNADLLLFSPSYSLTGLTSPALTFWTKYAFEQGYDYGLVYIDIGLTGNYSLITYYTGTSDLDGDTTGGSTTGWVYRRVNLPAAAAGQNVRFAFRTLTDGSTQEDGWYLDDVRVVQGYGVQEISPRPDYSQGFGRVDLATALDPAPPRNIFYYDEKTSLQTGQNRQAQLTVTDSSVPLRATLVWTDYPGDPSAAQALINDLDLVVLSPSSTQYYPNRLSGPDRVNNVEHVDVANPATGIWTIRVEGVDIPAGPQPFALVVSGAAVSPTAVEVSDFAVWQEREGVAVSWAVTPGLDVVGFHLYWAPVATGPYTRLNQAMIPTEEGQEHYRWLDRRTERSEPGFYKLEVVFANGRCSWEAPLSPLGGKPR